MSATTDLPAVRILFIGNSYTSRNRLPHLLSELARTAKRPTRVETESIVAGGASLRRHWNGGRVREVLAGSRWDYVVLQEQSTLPVKNAARYHDNVRLFAGEIARQGGKTVLYLTWARQALPQTQDDICRAIEQIGAEIHALIVPVGPAWRAALARDGGLRLYTDDGSHPTAAGSYLAACVFHACLFGEAPRQFSVSDTLHIHRDVAAMLHAVAAQAAP